LAKGESNSVDGARKIELRRYCVMINSDSCCTCSVVSRTLVIIHGITKCQPSYTNRRQAASQHPLLRLLVGGRAKTKMMIVQKSLASPPPTTISILSNVASQFCAPRYPSKFKPSAVGSSSPQMEAFRGSQKYISPLLSIGIQIFASDFLVYAFPLHISNAALPLAEIEIIGV